MFLLIFVVNLVYARQNISRASGITGATFEWDSDDERAN